MMMRTVSGRPIRIDNPHWRFDPLGTARGFGKVGDAWWTTVDGKGWYRCAQGAADAFIEGHGPEFAREPFIDRQEEPPHFYPEFPEE